MTGKTRTVKVAVVGSGLAGLSAAYFLSTAKDRRSPDGEEVEFEVHMFEKAESLGMDSHSETFTLPGSSAPWRVDVPMRSFQGGYYPQLIALYKHLGVPFRTSNFSYSFSYIRSLLPKSSPKLQPTLIYDGASGTRGLSIPTSLQEPYRHLPPGLSRLLSHLHCLLTFALTTLLILWNFLRLQVLAAPWFRDKQVDKLTWAAWAERSMPRGRIARLFGLDESWRAFVSEVCVPLFSAVCTSSREDVLGHPAKELLDFIWLTLGTHHYVVSNGVRDVVSRLTSTIPASRIHLGQPTVALVPHPSHPSLVSVVTASTTTASKAETQARESALTIHDGFSHVVFATQANHAVPILSLYADTLQKHGIGSKGGEERRVRELVECLEKFEYRRTVVVNHTDGSESMIPSDRRDRRDLNLVTVLDAPPMPMPTKHAKHPQHHHHPDSDYLPPDKIDPSVHSLTVPKTYTQTTHILPRPSHITSHCNFNIYQTTNPIYSPKPESVLSVSHLERALLTPQSKQAVRLLSAAPPPPSLSDLLLSSRISGERRTKLGRLQGAGRRDREGDRDRSPGIWVVGAYAYQGIPLLEGCVAGARDVVEQGVLECEGVRISRGWY